MPIKIPLGRLEGGPDLRLHLRSFGRNSQFFRPQFIKPLYKAGTRAIFGGCYSMLGDIARFTANDAGYLFPSPRAGRFYHFLPMWMLRCMARRAKNFNIVGVAPKVWMSRIRLDVVPMKSMNVTTLLAHTNLLNFLFYNRPYRMRAPRWPRRLSLSIFLNASNSAFGGAIIVLTAVSNSARELITAGKAGIYKYCLWSFVCYRARALSGTAMGLIADMSARSTKRLGAYWAFHLNRVGHPTHYMNLAFAVKEIV